MLNILGMIILTIILLIIIILIPGIKISLEYAKKDNTFKGCLKILILKKIRIYTHSFPQKDDEKDDDKEREGKKRDLKKILNLTRPGINDLMDYLKSITKTINIKKIQNHLIFGMESYADTGKYIGIIWGLISVINTLDENMKLSAEPSFAGSVINAEGINQVEIYPLKMIAPTLKLIRKKHIRKLIRGVLDER